VKASKNFIPYVNVMARFDEPPDQEVFEKYGLMAFPTFLFLDSEGKKLFEFRPETEEMTAEAVADAKILAAADTESQLGRARVTLVSAMRGVKEVDDPALENAAAVPGLEAEMVTRYREFLEKRPFREALQAFQDSVQKAMQSGDREAAEAAQKAVAGKMYSLFKDGKKFPVDGSYEYLMAWNFVFEGAIAAKDREAADAAIAALASAPQAKEEGFSGFLDQLKQRAKAL
jgi:hypothetical protein